MHYKISVIIPTLNEAEHLPRLLQDLRGQTLPVNEIIVVDASSTDGTATTARQANAKVITSSEAGVAIQRTMGGNAARHELLYFLDADVTLPQDFIECSSREFASRGLGVACPRYKPDTASIAIRSYYAFLHCVFYVSQKLRPSGAGSCIIVRKNIFQTINGFDRSLRFEDLGFIRAASRKGRFGTLSCSVLVSPRRFLREGALRLMLKYTLIGTLVFFGPTRLANIITYQFGHYNDNNPR